MLLRLDLHFTTPRLCPFVLTLICSTHSNPSKKTNRFNQKYTQTGTVVQLYYSESHWPRGRIVPYQVKLDDNRLIFAPMDDDRVIRALPCSPLHDCLDNNDLNKLRELCSASGSPDDDDNMPGLEGEPDPPPRNVFLNRPNIKGDPPIIYLLRNELFKEWEDDHVLEACTILKEAGAALGTCDMKGNTVLHCAAERGSLKVMEAVLEWTKDATYCLGNKNVDCVMDCCCTFLWFSTVPFFFSFLCRIGRTKFGRVRIHRR